MAASEPDGFESENRALSDPGNRSFADVLAARLSRRAMLAGAAAAALAAPFPARAQAASSLTFKSLAVAVDETHHVAEGYRADLLVRWGDAVEKGAPAFDVGAQTGPAQARQFGYNCDYLAYLPVPRGSNSSERGVLWVNHEYCNSELMRPGLGGRGLAAVAGQTKDWVDVEIAAHGGSILEVERRDGVWRTVADSPLNRRITMQTPMRIAGPAAGHARLKTKADPDGLKVLGTLNNCAGGKTPWGTVLTGEENTNFYFAGDVDRSPEARNHARMGIRKRGAELYAWDRFHDRFDIDKEPNEPNRFGWVVEIDPYDPASVPVKRTALGRFKHEGATCAIARDGRVVVYSGDDQLGEYIYKFVTEGRFTFGDDAANRNLLDSGTLYVARFEDDGTLAWLPLVHGQGKLSAENGFMSQADVLIEARRAADLLGATRMDRPEDIETNPVNGRVYVALTNNAERGKRFAIDKANPRAQSLDGHIVEIVPDGGDHAALASKWEIFLLAGNPADPAIGARYHPEQAATGVWFSSPDNVAFDPQGRLYISTDQGGRQRATKIADGVFACDVAGPAKALVKLLFACPIGAEMCGPEFTPDGRTLFVAVQHPGEGSRYENPSTRWPDFKPDMPPRPSVVAITRPDGRAIGT